MVGAPQPVAEQSWPACASAIIRMRANLRQVSCDAITHTQQGLSANIPVAALPQASAIGNDEWQQMSGGCSYGNKDKCNATAARCAGVQPGCELTLCPVGRLSCRTSCVRSQIFVVGNIRCQSSNVDPTMQRTSDVFAKVERYFCGNSVYGSKIAVVFSAQPATAFTLRSLRHSI